MQHGTECRNEKQPLFYARISTDNEGLYMPDRESHAGVRETGTTCFFSNCPGRACTCKLYGAGWGS